MPGIGLVGSRGLIYSPSGPTEAERMREGTAVALLETALPGRPKRRGKVRDVYDLGDGRLLLVATDRISAFDWVLPTGIPDKGRLLTALTLFWLDFLRVPNHLLSTDVEAMGAPFAARRDQLQGRSCLVKKTQVV